MAEVVYTQIELNPARTFITGVWCDGVYFSTEPPMAYTPGNAQWVKDQVITLANEDEACERWRTNAKALARRRDLEEFRERQYRFELQQENYADAAVDYLENFARNELRDELNAINRVWFRLVGDGYKTSRRDRERQIVIEALEGKQSHVEIGKKYGVTGATVSHYLFRERQRAESFRKHDWKRHHAKGQIQEPEPEIYDLGEGVEWTPEAQHQEFELLRGIR